MNAEMKSSSERLEREANHMKEEIMKDNELYMWVIKHDNSDVFDDSDDPIVIKNVEKIQNMVKSDNHTYLSFAMCLDFCHKMMRKEAFLE